MRVLNQLWKPHCASCRTSISFSSLSISVTGVTQTQNFSYLWFSFTQPLSFIKFFMKLSLLYALPLNSHYCPLLVICVCSVSSKYLTHTRKISFSLIPPKWTPLASQISHYLPGNKLISTFVALLMLSPHNKMPNLQLSAHLFFKVQLTCHLFI